MYFAIFAFLCLFTVGRSAPLAGSSCENLIKPIEMSAKEMLGKWLYIGSSSDLPGARSFGHLMTSAWIDLYPSTKENILNLMQTQRIAGDCSSYNYSVGFENNAMLIEEPFYLKEVYLKSDCPDCLVIYEEIISGEDKFTSVLLFSKSKSVSPAVVEVFQKQVECFKMSPPIMIDTNYEICPDPGASAIQGLFEFKSMLDAKMTHRIIGLFDRFFDMFVN